MTIVIHLVSLALIILGIVGAVIQVIPSGVLVGLAVLIWAIYLGTTGAWVVFAITVVILLAATLAKFALPGRHLNQSGIPKSTLAVGLAAAILGYFIIPVVGFIFGLVLGVYVMEYRRTATIEQAKEGTITVLKAVGLSIAIEVFAALVVATIWAAVAVYYAIS